MSENKTVKGKWALVTGSSRGVGKFVAQGLASHGCNVIVHGRKLENTESTMELLSKYDVKSYAVSGELGNVDEESQFAAKIKEEIGSIDILYNNAAVMSEWHDDILSIDFDGLIAAISQCHMENGAVLC